MPDPISLFLEDLLIANALRLFNAGDPRFALRASAVIREVPRERLAALWPERRRVRTWSVS